NPNWSSMNNGLPLSGCEQLVEDNNGTLYVSVAGLTSCLYKSLNQGISWLPITTMPIPANVYYVSAPVLKIDNNNNIYAVQKASPSFNSPISLPDRLFRSTDNGTSWTLLFVADSNSAGIFDVDLAIDSTIFIATGNNSIINPPQTDYLYSSDWGNSFSPLPNSISTPFAINDLVIAPNDSLYFLQDNILFKRSLGQWVQLMSNTWDSDPQQHPTNLYIDNLNKLYVTSRFEGVFYSTDNGTTWSNITTGLPPILYLPNTPPIHIYDIQFDGNNIPYALSTDIDAVNTGGIYKFANSVITALKTSGVDNLIVNVYPNPVTNACTVSLNIKANEHFDLQIYNASGKLLKTFNRNESNNNQVTVDMSMYTAGLYFVKTITTNQTSVTKIVKE
ncbi:MAG: T9SS type A sorting domain-containing protein, partial [Bacteroidia bacterium]